MDEKTQPQTVWDTKRGYPAKGVVPYNTGEILIGIGWSPPQRPTPIQGDALRLQRALLWRPPPPLSQRLSGWLDGVLSGFLAMFR